MRNGEIRLVQASDRPAITIKKKLTMADRVARFDWAGTSVGPIADWPERFRTAVDMCLANPLPAFVWWGPELINIYNDAYAPLLGGRHPTALGKSARKVWASVWPMIADDVDAALHHTVSVVREHVKFVVKRKGYPDEMYFTYTFSPIPDGKGGVGGVFQVAVDETGKLLAAEERDRKVAETEALISEMKAGVDENLSRWQLVIANMPEGVILCDAKGNLLDWNRAAIEMHGYSADDDAARFNLSEMASVFEVSDQDRNPIAFAQWPLSQLLRGAVVHNQVVRSRRYDIGLELNLICNGTLIRGDDGSVHLALLTFHKASEELSLNHLRKPAESSDSPGEDDGQHHRRTAIAAANDVDTLLFEMDLTLNEQAFCKDIGEQLVNHAIDAYVKSARQTKAYDGSCIAASVAVAMRIVSDAV